MYPVLVLIFVGMDKQAAAQTLYNEGWQQKRIAQILKITEKTISRWKIAGRWDEQRARDHRLRDTAADQIMELINYQLRVLNAIKDHYDDMMAQGSDLDTLNKALIQNGQIDALYKMFAAVKGKEHTWHTYVKVIRELNEYLAGVDIDLAKMLVEPSDDFLNQKRKELA